jgi:hypothetical protein
VDERTSSASAHEKTLRKRPGAFTVRHHARSV